MKKQRRLPPFRHIETTDRQDRVFIKNERGEKVGTARIVSDAEARAAAFVVCIRASEARRRSPNSLSAPCSVCGETVIYSVVSPIGPPKVCAQCAAVTMILSGQSPDLITKKGALEEADRMADEDERRNATIN